MKLFYCRTIRLANYLMRNGSTMVRIDTNPESKYLTFVFKKDETIEINVARWDKDKENFV